jgi:stage V sporulation protein D (sporulation-specific penicillin-binding protein)
MFIDADELQQKAEEQWTREFDVSAKRGDILDRNGNALAHSAAIDTIYVNVNDVKDPEYLANTLSDNLDMDYETIFNKATDKTKSQVWIKRQVEKETADKIRALDIDGVGFTIDSKRYYPNSDFLTSVLGITSTDGIGLEGIEAKYNKYLAGKPGRIIGETDRTGKTIPYANNMYFPPEDGYNIVLTVDEIIQMFLEKALEEAYTEHNAIGSQGIVMDPSTGEILAVANYPDFDLNNPPREDMETLQDLIKNKVFTDAYEPGSTFKTVTAASVLDSGAMTLDTNFNCVGYEIIDGQKIKCWRDYHPHGAQTFNEAVQNSCNPAFMNMALQMGTDVFYNYIYDFGFGSKTGVDVIYEGEGIVRNSKYIQRFDLARIGFGQSVAVTPLQLINAVGTIVNGGELKRPMLVKELTDSKGNIVEEYKPETIRRVITEKTSNNMKEILKRVVEEGSGKNAAIEGYSVGGKTGTAQKYDDEGKVMIGKNISSFIGFAPVENPELVVLIVVDEPSEGTSFGSIVAAPYVKEVLESSLKYLSIPATYNNKTKYSSVPNVLNLEAGEAISKVKDSGLKYIMDGVGTVVSQSPAPGESMVKGSEMLLYMSEKQTEEKEIVIVPELMQLTKEEAKLLLDSIGLQMNIEREGTNIVFQNVPKGTEVEKGTIITVKLS